MTLPASGVITLNDIAVELGIANTGINLNQANVRALAGVPTGAISLSDFYGKSSAAVVASISGSIEVYRLGNPNVSLTLRFRSNGAIEYFGTPTPVGTASPNWFAPTTAGVGSGYFIRATLISGDAFSGLVSGSWTSLSSDRSVGLSRSNYGTATSQIQIDIAATAGGTILGSGVFTLYVESEP